MHSCCTLIPPQPSIHTHRETNEVLCLQLDAISVGCCTCRGGCGGGGTQRRRAVLAQQVACGIPTCEDCVYVCLCVFVCACVRQYLLFSACREGSTH